MFKYFLIIYCLLFSSLVVLGQDIWLQSSSHPNAGCDLTNNELVQVFIQNTGPFPASANSISVEYSINNGPVTSELVPAPLLNGVAINFSFVGLADLSPCQNHEVKVWVNHPGDANQTNDTLTWWVQNDCSVVPGYVDTTLNVCIDGNSGTLNLVGSNNGTILDWEYSINGGSSWTPTGNSTASLSYSMITTPTIYRVQLDGGYCPNVVSDPATITPVSPPNLGLISVPDSVCISSANGVVSLSGTASSIVDWESSVDGTTWSSTGESSSNLNYNLTETTYFRALIDGNGCPNEYSNPTHVYVEEFADGGAISGSDSLCISNASGSLLHSGVTGPIDHWEWSNDGVFWNNIENNNSNLLVYSGLNQTTFYRVLTLGTFCPDQYSDIAEIYIQPEYIVPNLLGGGTVCETSITGVCSLDTVPTNVLSWEFSEDNGSSWVSVVDNSSSYDFSGLTNSSDIRVLLEGNLCPDYYSTIANVTIDKGVEGGVLSAAQDSFCISNSAGAVVNTSSIPNLDIDYWEYSTDNGASWQQISVSGSTYSFPSLTESMWIRSHTNGGACPDFYSDTVELFVEDEVVSGILSSDTLVCGPVSGVLNLSGSTGTIDRWEWSDDSGSNWNNIIYTLDNYAYSSISTSTQFRVFSTAEICPGVYSNTVNIEVDDFSDAGVLLEDVTICSDDTVHLEIQNSLGDNYVWQTSPDAVSWSNHTSLNVIYDSVHGFSTSQFFQFFRVIVSNGICPEDTSNSVRVTILPAPGITVSPDTSIIIGESVSIWGAGGNIGLWEESPYLSDPNSNTTDVNPEETQYFYYGVVDNNGCTAIDSVLVEVLPPINFDIKNVVTTNNDGFNDTWIIEGVEYFPNTSVKVFNVYGKMVYSSDDYQNDWAGTFKGKTLPNGTYLYVVTLSETNEEIKGTITLLGDTK